MNSVPRLLAAASLAATLTLSSLGLVLAPAAQASPASIAGQAQATKVTALAKVSAVRTKITSQPRSLNVRGGAKATFKVKATGASLRYQWQVKAPGKKSFSNIKGASKASYTTPAQANKSATSQYRVVVRGAKGTATSSVATLKVKAYASTKILTQPKSASIRGAAAATFSVKASGEALSYQWQVAAPGKTTFVNIKGASKSTFITPKQSNKSATSKYRVIVSGKGGKVTSSAASLKVTAWAKPVLKGSPALRVQFVKGQRVTVTGKGLSGASFSILAEGTTKTVLKRVSSTDTAVVLEVTATNDLDVNRLVVSNPAGAATADILLMSKHTMDEQIDVWNVMVDSENEILDEFGNWEPEFSSDVELAFATVNRNAAYWKPVDIMSAAVVSYAKTAQQAMFDPSVEQADFEAAFDAFEKAADILDWLVNF